MNLPSAPLRFVLALAIVGAGSAASESVRAACPVNYIVCGPTEYPSTQPVYAVQCRQDYSASYDIPNAHLAIQVGDYVEDLIRRTMSIVADEFTVLGPGPGDSYELRLRVHMRMHAVVAPGSSNNVSLMLNLYLLNETPTSPRVFKAISAFSGTSDKADSLDLVIPMTGNAPIGLVIEANGNANFYAVSSNTLDFEFVGLPPGWGVTSCNGFRQDPATPALARSWGSLKAAYR
jgi:hypothetical protein